MYLLLAELAERPGATELSQVATPLRHRAVAPELLDALLRGQSTDAWPAEQVEIGNQTLEVINSAIEDASAVIDGYLRRRYSLPLAQRFTIVSAWARQIARYMLHKDRSAREDNDPIVRDYRDALRFLQLVADGKFSLGQDDPVAPANTGTPSFSAPARIFSSAALKDF